MPPHAGTIDVTLKPIPPLQTRSPRPDMSEFIKAEGPDAGFDQLDQLN